AASAAWGIAPSESFLAVALAILVTLGSSALVQLLASESRVNLLHMGEGLWAAFIFGLVYLAIEVASGQAVKILAYNLIGLRQEQLSPPTYFVWSGAKLIAIAVDDLKRNMGVLVMFLWPSVAAIIGTMAKPRSLIIASISAALTIAVVLLASHGTSKLAII